MYFFQSPHISKQILFMNAKIQKTFWDGITMTKTFVFILCLITSLRAFALDISQYRAFSELEDFISNKAIEIHAYDHTVRGAFWPKFFIKRFLSVLIGRFSAPYNAVTTYKNFLSFFKDRAVLFFEKIGSEEDGATNLKKTIQRIKGEPIFLKIDIEGYEYQILDEIIVNSALLSGMVIEFHKVSEHIDEIKSFIDAFELELVHIHPNNNRIDEQGNPRAIEMSFAREPKKISQTANLPHPLDQLNVPRK